MIIHRVDRERRPRDAAYHFTGAIDEWMMLNCLHLPVVAHTLPESLGIDGLLGLDFADTEMTINFCDASITVA